MDYIHINVLLGYVENVLIGGILSADLDRATEEAAALAAFNKLLWLQNDFFAKYYMNPTTSAPQSPKKDEKWKLQNLWRKSTH